MAYASAKYRTQKYPGHRDAGTGPDIRAVIVTDFEEDFCNSISGGSSG